MGNSPRKAKGRNSSAAQDALQTLRPEEGFDRLQVPHEFHHTSKDNSENVITQSFAFDDDPETASDCTISEHVSGHVESPEQLNLYNLHSSFLSSFLSSSSKDYQKKFQSLYDVVKSPLWSVHSAEYVTMCASNILSILKIYGGSIPKDPKVINEKSWLMFHVLDSLHDYISQIKSEHGHFRSSSECQSCHGCDTRLMMLKHIVLRNSSVKDNFCLICLEFHPKGTYLQHSKLANHVKVKSRLIQDIFAYSCTDCDHRFTSQKDMDTHNQMHGGTPENRNKAHVVKVFDPVCCFLCRISFSNNESLLMHEVKSLEHASRKEIAMEIAQRVKYASDGLCNLDDNTANGNNSPELAHSNRLENAVKETSMTEEQDGFITVSLNSGDNSDIITHSAASNAMYYCSPCEVFVPKANVINHECGQRHSQSCKTWAVQFQKASQTSESKKVNQESNSLTIKSSCSDLSIHSITDKIATSKNFSIVNNDCFTEKEIEKTSYAPIVGIDGYKIEATENSVNAKAQTVDTDCCYVEGSNNTDFSIAPVVKKDCSILEDMQKTADANTPIFQKDHLSPEADMKNAKTSIVEKGSFNETISSVTDDQIRKKIEEYLAMEETVSRVAASDGYYSCQQCPTGSLHYPIMLSHVTGKWHLTSGLRQDHNKITRKVDILNHLLSIKSPKNKHLLNVVSAMSAKRVIQHAACQSENVTNTPTELESAQISIPDSSVMSPQNVISSYLNVQISTLSKHNNSLDSADQMGTSQPSSINNVSQHGVPCHFEESPMLSNQSRAIDDMTRKSSQRGIVCVEIIESQMLKDSRSQDALISEVEALVIGEETGSTLLDQLHQACPGKDLGDYETQCGTCGVVFQIYNGDLDLSLDMHVQNDPQHLLAIEVPTQRDPQAMAESAKTSNVSQKGKSQQKTMVSSKKVSIADTSNGKSQVIAEVFSLEQKNIETKERNHYCKLCRLYMKNDTQFLHHLLFPQHLSERWIKDLTDEDVNQKVLTLKSLLRKYKYGSVALQNALHRISSLMAMQNRSTPQAVSLNAATSSHNQSVKVTAPINSRIFVASSADDGGLQASSSGTPANYCHICSKNLSNMSQRSRITHMNLCKVKISAVGAKSTGVAVPLSGSLDTTSSHMGSKRPRHICHICHKTMDLNDKLQHERGKGHQANLLINKK